MLENPDKLREMVEKTGACTTDRQSPESVGRLCDKCQRYAQTWAPAAQRLWQGSCREKAAKPCIKRKG